MNGDKETVVIEDASRRAAEAIRRRDPDALAGRIPRSGPGRGEKPTKSTDSRVDRNKS